MGEGSEMFLEGGRPGGTAEAGPSRARRPQISSERRARSRRAARVGRGGLAREASTKQARSGGNDSHGA
jgi:hypothetical protein